MTTDLRNQSVGWRGWNWLAIYAAIVATMGLGWNVWTFSHQAGRIAAIPLATVVDAVTANGKTTIKYPFLVLNTGGRPVNLFGVDSTAKVGGLQAKSSQTRSLRKGSMLPTAER